MVLMYNWHYLHKTCLAVVVGSAVLTTSKLRHRLSLSVDVPSISSEVLGGQGLTVRCRACYEHL